MEKLLNMTLGQMFENTVAKYPSHQAVKHIEKGYDVTYYELNQRVDKIAKGLLGMGFRKGDHISIWATNYPEWIELLFATIKIGVVLITVNTAYKTEELEYLLKQSDTNAIFICSDLKDIDSQQIMYEICPELKTCKLGDLKAARLPELRMVVSIDSDYEGMYCWKQIADFGVLISDKEYDEFKALVLPDDIINMQYTSGTTGFPKGVMLTHFALVNQALTIGEQMKMTQKDRLCITVPFFHCFGVVGGLLLCAALGATMVPVLAYNPIKVMHTIEYEKCTMVHGVPTMFIAILMNKNFDKYNFSTLRTGIMGGALCPEKVMLAVVNKMNLREMTIAYGLTEASPGVTFTGVEDPISIRSTTVGKCLPFMEVKIINPETGEECPTGVSGELCVKGYNVMKGYYKMPEATAEAVRDGWLHTGDLADVDKDGYYRITGRIKDMIIRGGENIFPKEIEDCLYTHPAVSDVQIVSVPSDIYGEEVYAFIVLKKDMEATEKEIKAYVEERKAKHKVPSYVSFIAGYPMTASGKVQKFKLREMAKEMLGIK